jgi:hypothetical protein
MGDLPRKRRSFIVIGDLLKKKKWSYCNG